MKKGMSFLSKLILFVSFIFLSHISYAISDDLWYQAAYDSYVYAYPLVLMDISKSVMTNVPAPTPDRRAPINQFGHGDKIPTPDYHDFVRPNADTLYSFAWLDLSAEPIVLSVPDTNDRYYLLPLLDAWTEIFASIGKRTTGTKKHDFLIVGPDWAGVLPNNLEIIRAPTNVVWIMGRTLTLGEDDYDYVHTIQQGYRLTPLSQWGQDYHPPSQVPIDPTVDMSTPEAQVEKMDGVQFFTQVARILKINKPHPEDTEILKELSMIGIVPGKDFDAASLNDSQINALNTAAKSAMYDIKIDVPKNSEYRNGWLFLKNSGHYGTNYMDRSAVAFGGLGANLPEDALYPATFRDINEAVLVGKNKYVVHFDAKQLPPVHGFWSITLYGFGGYFIANPLNRYAIGDRNALQFNKDGSLDLYIQRDSPGISKESNWLPAPDGNFNLTMRLYWPAEEIYSGVWNPPAIKKY